ncbi:carbohydrate-binding module family 48 protein [Ascoidea rubescens DSM 1968]|uniref:Carbohydrate-binding module family 48 protein n=1 Tax=Ascoidea rubescens DSM 1968 TaxID=1344418 RepID=A0A1D2VAW4_9ASCO|nr:carbohydrate-binding module family 48 protein [Ascoidea rubescens DSM 1968]ODV58798.1 carbohydrate-binding module family 48 protein [Ascoidea rubescens DSM 1968]
MTSAPYYTFEWPNNNNSQVYVTGTFDSWSANTYLLNLDHNSNVFKAKIKFLPSTNDKIYFKFIVDGNWLVNQDFKIESDSNGFQNNILYPNDLIYESDITNETSDSSDNNSDIETIKEIEKTDKLSNSNLEIAKSDSLIKKNDSFDNLKEKIKNEIQKVENESQINSKSKSKFNTDIDTDIVTDTNIDTDIKSNDAKIDLKPDPQLDTNLVTLKNLDAPINSPESQIESQIESQTESPQVSLNNSLNELSNDLNGLPIESHKEAIVVKESIDKPIEKTTEIPFEEPAQKSTAKPIEEPIEKSIEKPTEIPTEIPEKVSKSPEESLKEPIEATEKFSFEDPNISEIKQSNDSIKNDYNNEELETACNSSVISANNATISHLKTKDSTLNLGLDLNSNEKSPEELVTESALIDYIHEKLVNKKQNQNGNQNGNQNEIDNKTDNMEKSILDSIDLNTNTTHSTNNDDEHSILSSPSFIPNQKFSPFIRPTKSNDTNSFPKSPKSSQLSSNQQNLPLTVKNVNKNQNISGIKSDDESSAFTNISLPDNVNGEVKESENGLNQIIGIPQDNSIVMKSLHLDDLDSTSSFKSISDDSDDDAIFQSTHEGFDNHQNHNTINSNSLNTGNIHDASKTNISSSTHTLTGPSPQSQAPNLSCVTNRGKSNASIFSRFRRLFK